MVSVAPCWAPIQLACLLPQPAVAPSRLPPASLRCLQASRMALVHREAMQVRNHPVLRRWGLPLYARRRRRRLLPRP